MRLHINFSPIRVNEFQTLLIATALDGKGEWPSYVDNPNEMAPGIKRCRWVRYRMEGGGGPQPNPLKVEQRDYQ